MFIPNLSFLILQKSFKLFSYCKIIVLNYDNYPNASEDFEVRYN